MDQYWVQEYENLVTLIESEESQINRINDNLQNYSYEDLWIHKESIERTYDLIRFKNRQFRKIFRDLYRHGIRVAGAHRKFEYVTYLQKQIKLNIHLFIKNCDPYLV